MKSINASPYICDIIENGYVILFISEPGVNFFRNNASSRKHPNVLKELLKYWRSCFINVFLFLDDGFSCSTDFESTQ